MFLVEKENIKIGTVWAGRTPSNTSDTLFHHAVIALTEKRVTYVTLDGSQEGCQGSCTFTTFLNWALEEVDLSDLSSRQKTNLPLICRMVDATKKKLPDEDVVIVPDGSLTVHVPNEDLGFVYFDETVPGDVVQGFDGFLGLVVEDNVMDKVLIDLRNFAYYDEDLTDLKLKVVKAELRIVG